MWVRNRARLWLGIRVKVSVRIGMKVKVGRISTSYNDNELFFNLDGQDHPNTKPAPNNRL